MKKKIETVACFSAVCHFNLKNKKNHCNIKSNSSNKKWRQGQLVVPLHGGQPSIADIGAFKWCSTFQQRGIWMQATASPWQPHFHEDLSNWKSAVFPQQQTRNLLCMPQTHSAAREWHRQTDSSWGIGAARWLCLSPFYLCPLEHAHFHQIHF